MSSWPFMACDKIRKRHLNDIINAIILKSMKNRKEALRIIQVKPTDAEIKHFACFLYPRMCQLSEKYKSIMDGFKTQNNELWDHYWRLLVF